MKYKDKLRDHFRKKRLESLTSNKKFEKPEAKVGAAHPKRFSAIDGNGNSIDPGKAVCAIFRQEDSGDLKLIGTGFFICNNGVFVTAGHVLRDVLNEDLQQERAIVVLDFSPNKGYAIRNLICGIVKNESDVGIGLCREQTHNESGEKLLNKILCISSEEPSIGDRIFTYAYPNTVHRKTDKEEIHLNPLFYEGKVTEIYPDGRDSVFLPSKCYQTSITIHGGASGGPVFNEKGHVIGINSTGFEGCNDVSFISAVQDVWGLSLPNVKLSEGASEQSITVRELQKLGHVVEK